MEEIKIQIKKVKSIESEKIINLYKDAGWWTDEDNKNYYKIKDLVSGSYAFIGAFMKDNLIGMCRIISDGCFDAYIQDLIVKKEFQKKGIGLKILKFAVDYLIEKEISRIVLIGKPNTYKFYKKAGFSLMKKFLPMKYEH